MNHEKKNQSVSYFQIYVPHSMGLILSKTEKYVLFNGLLYCLRALIVKIHCKILLNKQ